MVDGLPASLLEFHALVNIGCAFVTYLCWFGKPLGVRTNSMRDVEGFEEFLTVMLFRTEMRERENSDIKSRERLSAPDEVDLWAGKKDGKMEVVKELEYKSIALRVETAGGFWAGNSSPKRYPDIADGEVHISLLVRRKHIHSARAKSWKIEVSMLPLLPKQACSLDSKRHMRDSTLLSLNSLKKMRGGWSL